MACTLGLSPQPSGSCKVLPTFQYYLQFCLLLCNVPEGWRSEDFSPCSTFRNYYSFTCLFTSERSLKHTARRKVAMLLHKATVIFPNCSVGGKLQTSLLADESCGCCRSGVSLESYAVGWSPGRYIFGCWLVHVSQAIQNFIPLIPLLWDPFAWLETALKSVK